MELQTVSQVSRNYGISTRMLSYYEQIGLLQSQRIDDYAYRVYDENAVRRLRQIIILRKLRVPVAQIVSILNNSDAVETMEIFRNNINRLDEEITALSTVKSILTNFVDDLKTKANVNLKLDLLDDETMFSAISSLSFSDNQIKKHKEKASMENLNKANEDLKKMVDKDVRIVYLPPMTVAAFYAKGENPESESGNMIHQFVRDNNLLKIKPDLRSFGFHPQVFQNDDTTSAGYEAWVSIPDDMDVPSPLIKRKFTGGLYAAHILRDWDFADWQRLKEWVEASDKYENDWGSDRGDGAITGQSFDETLNYYNYVQNPIMENLQIDLLYPIKEKA